VAGAGKGTLGPAEEFSLVELRLPIRRRSPDRPVSPWPRWVFTIAVMVATFAAVILWLPADVPDRLVEAVRASATVARN